MDYSFSNKNLISEKNHEFSLHPNQEESKTCNYVCLNDLPGNFDPFSSLFDNFDKSDLKQYQLFKKISPINPLALNLNNKLFEDYVENMKGELDDNITTNSPQRYFIVFSHKNYKSKLVFFENGGPKHYLNLTNIRVTFFQNEHQIINKTGFFLEKNNRKIGYYTNSSEANELWLSILRNYCILKSFPFDYEILKPIRQENFSQVFQIRRKNNLSKKLSVKIYNANHYINFEETKQMISTEINILRQLHHPNIVCLLEVHEFRGIIYLVFEEYEGKSLENIFNEKVEITEFKKYQIIEQILLALKYIHSEGIIHRGIKPKNIILKEKSNLNEVVLIDFSLSVYYTKKNDFLFKNCGEPGYLAPELLMGFKYNYSIDIFAAGAIFFFILSGEPLFKGFNLEEITKQNYNFKNLIEQEVFKKLKNIIKCEWLLLLEKMLKRFYNERITASEALDMMIFKNINKETDIYIKNDLLDTHATIPNEGITNRQNLKIF